MSTTNNDPPDLMAKHVALPLHAAFVADRRCQALVSALSELLGRGAGGQGGELLGLDIGCGTGQIALAIELACPGVRFKGVDVIAWPQAQIDVTTYDGMKLPFDDKSFDFCLLVDVLHHTEQPALLLKEAVRITRRFILIKDHYCQNGVDRLTLRFMDWFGNRAHGVALP